MILGVCCLTTQAVTADSIIEPRDPDAQGEGRDQLHPSLLAFYDIFTLYTRKPTDPECAEITGFGATSATPKIQPSVVLDLTGALDSHPP